MFSFRKPSCPIDDDTRQWIDDRMNWLIGQYGFDAPQNATVVVPTKEFFPDHYEPTEDCLQALFDRMCDYMQVDRSRVSLQYYEHNVPVVASSSGLNDYQSSTSGIYEESNCAITVWLNVNCLDDPPAVVATMAHELGHVHLLGDSRLSDEDPDHEPLTDLLTVFMGLGVLTANAALRDRNFRVGNMEGWSIGRQGYLTMPVFGYALAWFAFHRKEENPFWATHLRLDVRSSFKTALKFLASQA